MTDGPDGPDDLVLAAARDVAARHAGVPPDRAEAVRTLSGTWIVLAAEVVLKVHAPGADADDLAARLALAAHPALRPCVLAPLLDRPVELTGDQVVRWATVWPRVDPLPQDAEAAPWAEAGQLLARLHGTPLPTSLPVTPAPVQGSVTRLRTALARFEDAVTGVGAGQLLPIGAGRAADVVRGAAQALPAAGWSADGAACRPRTVVHGDWHLGQLARLRLPGTPRWRLVDVDDLGVGDPVWDLGRPAAFWAAGLLPDDDWSAFVRAYRREGGRALPPEPADPWAVLDPVARACVVLAAAGAVRRAVLARRPLGEVDARMVEVCDRLTHAP